MPFLLCLDRELASYIVIYQSQFLHFYEENTFALTYGRSFETMANEIRENF